MYERNLQSDLRVWAHIKVKGFPLLRTIQRVDKVHKEAILEVMDRYVTFVRAYGRVTPRHLGQPSTGPDSEVLT